MAVRWRWSRCWRWLALLPGSAALPPSAAGHATACTGHASGGHQLLRRALHRRQAWRLCARSNRPVFVDATAAWCITCLVNEESRFSDAERSTRLRAEALAYLVADWTNRNPEITALLKENGRSGVPLYLYYAPGCAKAEVLPQILTPKAMC